MDATASTRVSIGFFNKGLYRWEPVLEETPLAAAVHRSDSRGESDVLLEGGDHDASDADGEGGVAAEEGRIEAGAALETQLTLPEVANLNVSHALVAATKEWITAAEEVSWRVFEGKHLSP